VRALATIKVAILPVALLLALAWTAYSGWRLSKALAERSVVSALIANHDVTPPNDAGAEVLFARAYYLLVRDRIDEAQGYGQPIVEKGDPALASRFYYDLGNARLRRAIARVEASKIDDAIPEVRLAKEAYRAALIANPDLWDARYNLDVAMRLVRDFPELERGDEEVKGKAKKLWTDLPGLPRGLP
jgi:mxaK protein